VALKSYTSCVCIITLIIDFELSPSFEQWCGCIRQLLGIVNVYLWKHYSVEMIMEGLAKEVLLIRVNDDCREELVSVGFTTIEARVVVTDRTSDG
jgi:hypothetical protein